MSVIGSEILAGASGNQGYFIQRSLRFRSSASAYLSRTPSSASNQQKFTYSTWIKLGSLSLTTQQFLLNSGTGDANRTQLTIDGGLTIGFTQVAGGSVTLNLVTSAVYRDPSAWYHIVIVADTTQATASNRAKIYVNGVQVTAFGSSTYWSQNTNSFINTTNAHYIGKYLNGSSNPSDWYQTETHFIDGQALTPSSFGETSSTTGVWQAKKYSGTYGTNGFYLPFSNNSSTTTLGYDFSGNGNNWTTNNISLTSGSTYDSMKDVPTVGADASNYCVLNPLAYSGGYASITSGNLNFTSNAANWIRTIGTFAVSSGKWYWEFTPNNSLEQCSGIQTVETTTFYIGATNWIGYDSTGYGYYSNNGNKYNNNSPASYGASYGANDVIGVALDLDAGTLTFYKNGISQGTAYSGLSGTFVPAIALTTNLGANSVSVNFGQRPFAYTPPTGFKALNTYNLPTPTIGATASSQAGKYFTPLVYTGNGTNNRAITGVGFQPDLVWTKCRSTGYNNNIADVVRGANKTFYSNTTDAEATNNGAGYVSAFSSDGYTVTQGVDMNQVNANGDTYVSWNWKANGTGVSNTAGSITSTVSANTTSGFSIVTYTGTGSAATVGHGLGVAPSLIIWKTRNQVNNWNTYHTSLGNTKAVQLNLTSASDTHINYWNNTSPTSSVFSIGSYTSPSSINCVAYCFSEVAGFSKFGSYTGNGSTDGTFVYTGFRPKFVMIKRTDASGDSWFVQDSSRSSYNVVSEYLLPNSSDSAASYNSMDFLSNGFKIRATGSGYNASNGNYIYMAFAEAPTKFALAR